MRSLWIVGVGMVLASGCAISNVAPNTASPSSPAVSGLAASSALSQLPERPNPSSPAASGMVDNSSSSAVSEPPTLSETPPSPTLATMSAIPAAPPGAPKACTSAQLVVTLGERQQLMAQPAIALIFTNTSDSSCTLYGYPGVAGLDSNGHQVAQAFRTPQLYVGGAPTDTPTRVTLTSGAQASALIGASANPVNGATACPPDYAAVLATPPGTTTATKLALDYPSCSGLFITPVVPGATGGFFYPQASP